MEAAGRQVCSVRQPYTPQFAEGGTLRLMGISCSKMEVVCMACCNVTALSRICSSASSACEGCTTHCRQHNHFQLLSPADLARSSLLAGHSCRAEGLLPCSLMTSKLGWQSEPAARPL